MNSELEQIQEQQAAVREQLGAATEAEQVAIAGRLASLHLKQKRAEDEEKERGREQDQDDQPGTFEAVLGFFGAGQNDAER